MIQNYIKNNSNLNNNNKSNHATSYIECVFNEFINKISANNYIWINLSQLQRLDPVLQSYFITLIQKKRMIDGIDIAHRRTKKIQPNNNNVLNGSFMQYWKENICKTIKILTITEYEWNIKDNDLAKLKRLHESKKHKNKFIPGPRFIFHVPSINKDNNDDDDNKNDDELKKDNHDTSDNLFNTNGVNRKQRKNSICDIIVFNTKYLCNKLNEGILILSIDSLPLKIEYIRVKIEIFCPNNSQYRYIHNEVNLAANNKHNDENKNNSNNNKSSNEYIVGLSKKKKKKKVINKELKNKNIKIMKQENKQKLINKNIKLPIHSTVRLCAQKQCVIKIAIKIIPVYIQE